MNQLLHELLVKKVHTQDQASELLKLVREVEDSMKDDLSEAVTTEEEKVLGEMMSLAFTMFMKVIENHRLGLREAKYTQQVLDGVERELMHVGILSEKRVGHVGRNVMRAYSIALSRLSIEMDEQTLARLGELKDDDAVLRLRVAVSQRLAASRLRLVQLEQ